MYELDKDWLKKAQFIPKYKKIERFDVKKIGTINIQHGITCAKGFGHDLLVTQYRNKSMYELDKNWLKKAQFIPKYKKIE